MHSVAEGRSALDASDKCCAAEVVLTHNGMRVHKMETSMDPFPLKLGAMKLTRPRNQKTQVSGQSSE